ncbi:MAG: hypothetical protein GXO90_08275, partial [FCB group bacterium]|nr:hypothetical protein [FCB group bacterium]
PVTGDTVYQNPVELVFDVEYFAIGSPGTADGYLRLAVDGGDTSTVTSTNPIYLSDLSIGTHQAYLELVDNTGASLIPQARDEVTFVRGNHPPQSFSLLYAFTNNGNINITPNNLSTTRLFSWTASIRMIRTDLQLPIIYSSSRLTIRY